VHIEDELYCRQRQLLVLGNRVPVLAPDTWIAPNAVVIGDVDLFDEVILDVSGRNAMVLDQGWLKDLSSSTRSTSYNQDSITSESHCLR